MSTSELLSRLREAGIRLSVKDGQLNVSAPKGALNEELRRSLRDRKAELIELLADADSAQRTDDSNIPVADRSQPIPLSFAQQRIWFLEEFEGGSSVYNIPWAMRVRGKFDVVALQAALNDLAHRHESLRTVFVKTDEGPVQEIHDGVELNIDIIKMHGADKATVRRQIESWACKTFDLVTGPLFRVGVVETGSRKHVLVLVIHHIISDGWSLDVLQSELFALYLGHINGKAPELAPLPLQLADYAVWQRDRVNGSEFKQQLDYWKTKLLGAPALLEIPTDRPRPSEQSYAGSHVRRILPAELSNALKNIAKEQNATLFMVLLTAFKILLARYSGQDDIIVGTPIAGRQQTELEGLIGLFLNNLAMRTDLTGNPAFTELLQQVQATSLDAYAHQDIPFDRIVDALHPSRDMSHSPVYQVQFMLQNAPANGSPVEGLEFQHVEFDYGTSKFDLTLATAETEDGLAAEIEYCTDLFDKQSIERILEHFEILLQSIATNPGTGIRDLPIIDEYERTRLLVDWNETAVDYPVDATLQSLLEQQAENSPHAPALVYESTLLTYRELNIRANRLAHWLISQGVEPDDMIGVYMERSVEMVVALLGIIKAGGAYVPLDPDYPEQRLRHMLEDADIRILLTQSHLVAGLPSHAGKVLSLDTASDELGALPEVNPLHRAGPGNLAYVIFTSGSTGRPKGVMNEHHGICNRLLWMQDQYQLDSNDRVLQKTPFSFDVSVWEFFWPLITGATLVVARPGGHRDTDYLCRIICEHAVTTMHFVPSMLQVFLQDGNAGTCTTLQRVICSGEALSHDLQARFFATLDAGLHNLYGPTEAAIDVTYWPCEKDSKETTVPIGYPVANTQIYVVEPNGQPAPVGVAGELWIGGDQVARGYANRPDLTAECFIPDPFSARDNARIYRTGDLTRFRNDGAIEFLGRIDHQVKLRGFRIELGEIEASLDAIADIEQSLVMLREDVSGEKRLVAYLKGGSSLPPDIPAVRDLLKTSLPEYMVPAAFVVLDEFPLLPNGKIDRNALPEPTGSRDVGNEYIPPASAIESILAGIWSDLLRIDRVGIHDNFFELGGDSILSIQIITRAAKSGLHLTPKQVFQHQTIAELVAAVGTARQVEAEQGAITGSADLTPVQRWFFGQPEIDLHHFNQSIRLDLAEYTDPQLLEQALQAIVVHHDALRLTFSRSNEGWTQQFAAIEPADVLGVIDIAGLSGDDRSQRILDAANELQASLQLDSGCLLAAALFDSGAGKPQELIIVVHHLAMDGLSWRILLEDLEHACLTLQDKRPVELPPKTSSFKDWSEHLQEYAASGDLAGETNWWRERFAPEDAAVPVDRAHGENTVASARSIVVSLDSIITEQLLQDVPRAYRTQINDVLLTALGRAWQKWSDSKHLVLDLEGHGREEKFADTDVSRTIGWFTTIYPVHISIDRDEPMGDALKRIKEQLLAIPDRGLGFGVLKYLANSGLQDIATPQILFNYLGQFDQTFDASGLFNLADGPRGYEQSPQRMRSHLLDINCGVYGGRLQVSFSYSENLHTEATIKALGDNFREELEALIGHCVSGQNLGYTPSDFPLACLDQAATDKLVQTYTDIEDIYPITPMQHGMLFHSIFAEESADYLSQVYLTQVVWELEGKLHAGAFEFAWQTVTRRHASLRTSFHQSGVQDPLAIVHRDAAISIHSEDWSGLGEDQQTQRLEKLLADDREQSFDLAKAPLMRLYLLRYSKNNYRFVWSHHHIIMDGWSIPVLLDELFQAYAAALQNTTPQFDPVRSYREYIAWLGRQDRAAAEKYWRASLAGFIAPTPLPGAGKAYRGLQDKSSFAKCFVSLTPEETGTLREAARQQRLTVNTLAQGIWALVLSRYTGEPDVLFGATTSGRPADLENVEAMVGLFLNTLPVRARIEAQSSMRSWMAAIQDDQLTARQHEYASLTDIQGWSEVPRGTPLFHTLLIFENYPDVSSLWEDRNSIRVRDMRALGWTSFPLTASVSVSGQLLLRLAYDTEYFSTQTAERIGAEFSRMLRKVTEDPDVLVRDLLIDESEAGQLKEQPGPTNAFERFQDTALEASLVTRFEVQVERRGNAPAVATRNHRWSYLELNQRANAVAHALIDADIPAGERVGLILGQDAPMLAGLLGALKAGQAYVPLDPHAPAARLRTIINDAGLSALVAAPDHAGLAVELSAGKLPVVSTAGNGEHSLPNPAIAIAPDALAYILFTSGSTGTPKGVMQTHHNVLHHIRTYTNALHLAADDRLSLFSPYGFDAAVMDIYGALLNGACLVPIDIRDEESATDILGQLPELDITIFHSTPTVYRYLFEQENETDLARIRLVVLGGEEARPVDLELFQRLFRPDAIFINGLGPTESTLALQFFADHDTAITGPVIPVGTAVTGTEILLLDENGEPAGSSGEICIRGDYVTPGYWNAPELTAEAFIQDEQGRNSIYRTGDLGRYAPDGQLIFIGRRDAQIKVRGHRVEPGDIEVALAQHPEIERSVVILREDEPGKPRLTGYCVPAPGREPDMGTLRDYLLHLLPDYMIPAAFVMIREIPLTPNGKLDRNALPVPVWEADEETYVAPTTETEQRIAAIWSDVLGVEQVGMHEDFFALGGHSLIATQLMARVRDAVGQELSLRTLFSNPTVAGLCAAVDGTSEPGSTIAIQPHPRNRNIPMSLMQQRLWFLDRFEGDSTAYNIFAAVRMRGELNMSALQSAVNDLVMRHESLRTHFAEQDGKALQVIVAEPDSRIVPGVLTDGSNENISRVVSELARRPFDLEQGPLFETHMLKIGPGEHLLVIRMHHIIGDNRSMQIIYRDLLTLYSMHCGLDTEPLPILPVQYADYAHWQTEMLASEEATQQVDYWREQLTDAPTVLELPTDRPRPLLQSYAGTAASRMLSGELNKALQALGTRHRATLFMVLQAAFSMLLARYSGQDDIVVGTPVAGRKSAELDNLIGFFLNTVVLRTDLSTDPDFRALLEQVRDNTLEAYEHQDVPFEKLVEELQPVRDTSHSPIFQVMFTVLTPPPSPGDFPNLQLEAVNAEFTTAKFDLFMAMTSYDQGLGIHLEYNTDLFDGATIERLLDHFETLLAGIVASPDVPVSQLRLLDEAERQHVLTDFNDSAMETSDTLVHQLVEQQAELRPEEPAVCFGAVTLLYKELNERANRLARALTAAGASPGKLVAVCAERGIETVTGVLAILKAGAAYVPVDPRYPAGRIRTMLDDCKAPVLLTQAALAADLPEHSARVIELDTFDWASGDATNLGVQGESVYAIYTSGSTGKPKGVELTHAGLSNLIQWQGKQPGLDTPARTLQFASLSFDVSFQELFTTWAGGGTLVLVTEDERRDLAGLARFIATDGIERVYLPFAALQPLADAVVNEPGLNFKVRDVIVAGEQLQVTPAVRQMFATLGGARLHNQYGPSETHVVTAYTLEGPPDSWPALPPIGTPVANTQAYVLDANLEPVPVGVPGELYLGGVQVAKGYVGRRELTAEKFVTDPFNKGRMYRTGDRCRFLPDGALAYLGRTDDQVKWRGFRIEPGEIETALADHASVRQAAVLIREDNPGDKRLVAYVVGDGPDPDALRLHLKERLPDYMVPQAFVVLDALPLTPSGKVARRSLPVPDYADAAQSYVAPRTPTEAALTGIWADVLNVERVGIHDDFFALGGHSLLAMHLISRIRDALNEDLPLVDLFSHSTVAELAQQLRGSKAEDEIPRYDRGQPLPMSFAQQRLWFLDVMEPGAVNYNVPFSVRLRGRLDRKALQAAVDGIVARHESLRTTFNEIDNTAVQLIAGSLTVPVEFIEFTDASDADLREKLNGLIAKPFDLRTGPLFRAQVLVIDAEEHILLLSMHHIICDAWSQGLLYSDLAALYREYSENVPSDLPALPIQYADYAVWQRSQAEAVFEAEVDYWREQLDDAPPLLNLPLDKPRPPVETHTGATRSLQLDTQLAERLNALAVSQGCTLFVLLLAALQTLLHRYSGEDDLVVGTPISGRQRSELEGIIGFFLNTLAIRTDASGNPAFNELLARVKDSTLGAFAHQDLPFEKLVEELHPVRNLSHAPVFQVLFVLNHLTHEDAGFGNLSLGTAEYDVTSAKFDLQLTVMEMADGLTVNLLYNTDLFETDTADRMLGHYRTLLKAIVTQPETGIDDLALLDAQEQQRITADFNATHADYPVVSLAALVEAQTARTPDAAAVESGGMMLSYAELNARANRLARALIAGGAEPGSLVGLCAERCLDAPVAILAVLKAGCAYVPIDPDYPAERVRFMLADSHAPVLLTQVPLVDRIGDHDARVICLDTFDWTTGDDANLKTEISPRTPAYAIYTSGSTGQPKGVLLQQEALANLLQWQQSQPGLQEGARTLQFASFSFDVSFQELFSTWQLGGTLIMIDEELRRDLPKLARFVADNQVERLYLPFAALQPLVECILADGLTESLAVTDVIVAGEQLQITPAIRKLFGTLSNARLHNHYGPSETHVVTAYTLEGQPDNWPALPPIGTPVANTQIYVLDTKGRPAPIGVPGELYIGGTQVALGYLDREALTAEKFVADPFREGGRLFRTGDSARYRPGGVIDYLGRTDDQVKWRGFRIEPGEIEAQLTAHPQVRQAAVLLREDEPGDQRLVAYVVPEAGEEIVDADVRAYAKQKLPDYMVPSALVILDALPLTPSGKVARRKLPAPEWQSEEAYVAPRNELEQKLADIWASVLRVEQVGIHDDFFTLGGHSLLAMQLVSRIRDDLELELPLIELFRNGTVAEAAAGLGDSGQEPAIVPCDRTSPPPMSSAQQRLWFLDVMEPGSATYNVPWVANFEGELDRDALQSAVDELVHRHESLRTTFADDKDGPIQLIADQLHLEVEVIDQSDADEDRVNSEVSRLVNAPFNLQTGPLFRVSVIRTGKARCILILSMHHIICDAWSLGIVYHELAALYEQHRTGQQAGLPPLPLQYADYAAWERTHLAGLEFEDQIAYWKDRLYGAPPLLDLPLDKPRPPIETHNGASLSVHLDQALTDKLNGLAVSHGCTLFMLMLTAVNTLLYRYSGEDDLVVGTPISGRRRSELEGIIGFFLNTLTIRTDASDNPAFTELLERVKEATLGAFTHQDLPFEKLVEELHPARNLSHAPVFQVLFVLNHMSREETRFGNLQATNALSNLSAAKFDLQFTVSEVADGLTTSLLYNTDLFERDTIERMLMHFCVLLEAIAEQPDTGIDDLKLLDESERQKLLYDWNDTAFSYPADSTMHGLFEAQAALAPDAIALRTDKTELSYGELNRRANKLATALVGLGIGPDKLVGISIERSAEMVIGMLATLKAGGAYVPLDPAYPPSRVSYMLEDSRAVVLLTQSSLVAGLPKHAAEFICLDEFDWATNDSHSTGPQSAVTASDLGYVIYTSGSTGMPKGVAIEHRNAVALIAWAGEAFTHKEFAGVLASTSICFDLSVFEIFCTLGLGGRIVLVENALELPALPADTGVTLINTVPSAIAELVRMNGVPESVKTVNLAGELLTTRLVNDIYALGTVERINDLYGPSEDTTYSTWTLRERDKPPSIGRPVLNTQAYLLDANKQPVPIGVVGELYLGGSGVTRGYLGREGLTAERYVSNPFGEGRLYRTGDKARYRADGNLEFLGRIDHQVKLRGFRIELGEIETCLEQIPEVKASVAMVREDNVNDKRLVAYLVAEENALLDESSIRATLKKELPDYMVPAAFVILDALPMTPNGKLDRKRLPVPEWQSEHEYVPPRNELEQQLTDIWADVLGVEQVGIHDDFFALGGHSLLAMHLISRIRDALQVELPLISLFNSATVAETALELGVTDHELDIAPCDRHQPLPMSFAQQRLWFLDVMEPGAVNYNVPFSVRLHGRLDRKALQAAGDDIVARHESLRTTFADSEDGPIQIIAESMQLEVEEVRPSGSDEAGIRTELNRLVNEPFDLASGPLFRVWVIEADDDNHILVMCMHHIICDAWSLGIVYQELATLYDNHRLGRPTALPLLSIQYADYAVWQRSQADDVFDKQVDYWREQLDDAPPLLNLPLDKPRPPVETHTGATRVLHLDTQLAERLNALAMSQGCTLFVLLLAALQALLHRYSGEDDLVVGTPISGRQRSEFEGLIGFFLNTLAIRTDASGNPAFSELLSHVKDSTLGAFAHQDLPFEKLVEELHPVRNLSHAPIFQVLFVLNHLSREETRFGDLEVGRALYDVTSAKFDLQLTVSERPDGLTTALLYNTDLFNEDTAERMLGHYRALLEAIVAEPDTGIDDLALLDAQERQQIVADFNATHAVYPHTSLAALVEAQVEKTPDAVAIEAADARLSYAGLNSRANRLARALVAAGTVPGSRVGLCVERCPDAPVAILAVLKAGCAYVPIDPDYPPERVRFMLDDSGAPVLITQSALIETLGEHGAQVIEIDTFDWETGDGTNLNVDVLPMNPAYAIYTSGSTGQPKGVLLQQGALANLLQWQCTQPGLDVPARTLQFASLSFDVSFQELFSTWQAGGTLVMIDEALRRDLPALARLIADRGIERLYLPFAALQPLVECILADGLTDKLAVTDVIVAGEQLQITPAIRELFGAHPSVCLHNHYGPSETHVVTAYTLTGSPDTWPALPPIGKPVANTQIYLLDEQRRPVPIGVPGELYIGGTQVALGYLDREALTAEKFVADPFSTAAGARLFRTGDSARYRPDGVIDYLGRTDDQVKWRGFRIEPGEIESMLATHPQVRQAAVLLREDEPGDKRLVAYLVAEQDQSPDTADIRAYAKQKLPDYMLPSALVILDALPLTPSGKIARRKLPAPDGRRAADTGASLPSHPHERALAELWKRLLKVDHIALDDNFFDLGGHSLLTIRLIQEIKSLTGEELTIADVFENPTIREFAPLLKDAAWPDADGGGLGGLLQKVRGWFKPGN